MEALEIRDSGNNRFLPKTKYKMMNPNFMDNIYLLYQVEEILGADISITIWHGKEHVIKGIKAKVLWQLHKSGALGLTSGQITSLDEAELNYIVDELKNDLNLEIHTGFTIYNNTLYRCYNLISFISIKSIKCN